MPKFDRVLLASDFDNTLVYTQGALERGEDIPPVCPRDREALDYFMKNGGLFAVSTGRALPAFAEYARSVPMNAPCVIANGAGIYDFTAGRYLETAFLGEAIYDHLHALLAAFPALAFEVYHDDRRIHAMHPNRFIRAHEHLTRAPTQTVERVEDIDLPIIKVLFEEELPLLREVHDFIRAQAWGEDYELIYSGDHLLELTARGATKGGMILRLAALLGVGREDIYCIGDHANDLPMLAVSAVPFAPANAIDEVLTSGARIVSHCRDGAVADVVAYLDSLYGEKTPETEEK